MNALPFVHPARNFHLIRLDFIGATLTKRNLACRSSNASSSVTMMSASTSLPAAGCRPTPKPTPSPKADRPRPPPKKASKKSLKPVPPNSNRPRRLRRNVGTSSGCCPSRRLPASRLVPIRAQLTYFRRFFRSPRTVGFIDLLELLPPPPCPRLGHVGVIFSRQLAKAL